MNFKSCVAALGFCLLPLASQAGVIYEWRSLNTETPRDITLQLEFDQSTIDSGAFSYTIEQDYYTEETLFDSGLLGLNYSFPGAYQAMRFSRDGGFVNSMGRLELELSFETGGYLSGYIYANNTEHHFMMASTGNTFTVLDANSDQGMPEAGCGWTIEVDCVGATGQIRRTDIAGPVNNTDIPEPGSLALLGIGLMVAAGMRRKAAR